ncbi:MAG TPA: hypothetical protein VH475_04375, partial [Tepidisphaeraceae bacterium]
MKRLVRLPGLHTLDIGHNDIGDAGARAIAENLTGLHTLDIGYNRIGEAGARAIAENLTGLHTLHIGYNRIGDAGIAVQLCDRILNRRAGIGRSPPADRKPSIDLQGNPLRWPEMEGKVSETILSENDPAKLKALLLKLREEGSTRLHAARAVMAGPSMHGKTHLARWLTAGEQPEDQAALRRAIPLDQRTWGFHPASTTLRSSDHNQAGLPELLLRVIDCGGHLEQLQSHHNLVYLGSRRSVFILCVRADRGFAESWADYHLGLIGSLRIKQREYDEGDDEIAARGNN